MKQLREFGAIDAINEVKKAGDADRNQWRYDTMRETDYNFIAYQLKKYLPKNILEIGSAYGTLSLLLKKRGFDIDTLDILDTLHSKKIFKKYKIPFQKCDIAKEIPFDKQYDMVILTEVLEHLATNPLNIMKRITDKMAEGGFMILSTPAREISPPLKIAKWTTEINWQQIPEVKNYKWKDGEHHHYYLWEIIDLLSKTDLKIHHIFYRSGWFLVLRKTVV
ncbi:MAG: bifunctional 3-demethylubiquinone-9 3-methyltransferase/ 2-octaprenyl-6-hydroxy phenol methylase [Firmicutes bacterium ADurb.Bin419]|nr:MAG: bifunctional 3-demethylubiquinone-9 3-methyltransferase/ 2-octaprenyl-6-hydroxy phenol methylase [Firmicutes bacterium ADurb.Bin419]